MDRDSRARLIRNAMEGTNWDLLVCAMPANVLLLSGYWPGLGHSLAAAVRSGEIFLIAPHDERDLADESWADEVITYQPAPLDRLVSAEESLYDAFTGLKKQAPISADRIGFEQADIFEPAGYSPHLFRGNSASILRRSFPSATLAPADEMLVELRSTKTPAEIRHISNACRIAEHGFRQGVHMLRAGLTEAQTAAAFRLSLTACMGDSSINQQGARRCDGFMYCASGENSRNACGPFGRSRTRQVGEGDLVICRGHCYSDGYWADIARTYHIGRADGVKRRMLDAVLAARDAALRVIKPGVHASRVDAAAREILASRGFQSAFPHPAGHGAGFGAMDYAARPRLHPKSEDRLEPGMVLALEPGVYVDGTGGTRVADMISVTENGREVLTPFQWDVSQLEIRN